MIQAQGSLTRSYWSGIKTLARCKTVMDNTWSPFPQVKKKKIKYIYISLGSLLRAGGSLGEKPWARVPCSAQAAGARAAGGGRCVLPVLPLACCAVGSPEREMGFT